MAHVLIAPHHLPPSEGIPTGASGAGSGAFTPTQAGGAQHVRAAAGSLRSPRATRGCVCEAERASGSPSLPEAALLPGLVHPPRGRPQPACRRGLLGVPLGWAAQGPRAPGGGEDAAIRRSPSGCSGRRPPRSSRSRPGCAPLARRHPKAAPAGRQAGRRGRRASPPQRRRSRAGTASGSASGGIGAPAGRGAPPPPPRCRVCRSVRGCGSGARAAPPAPAAAASAALPSRSSPPPRPRRGRPPGPRSLLRLDSEPSRAGRGRGGGGAHPGSERSCWGGGGAAAPEIKPLPGSPHAPRHLGGASPAPPPRLPQEIGLMAGEGGRGQSPNAWSRGRGPDGRLPQHQHQPLPKGVAGALADRGQSQGSPQGCPAAPPPAHLAVRRFSRGDPGGGLCCRSPPLCKRPPSVVADAPGQPPPRARSTVHIRDIPGAPSPGAPLRPRVPTQTMPAGPALRQAAAVSTKRRGREGGKERAGEAGRSCLPPPAQADLTPREPARVAAPPRPAGNGWPRAGRLAGGAPGRLSKTPPPFPPSLPPLENVRALHWDRDWQKGDGRAVWSQFPPPRGS